MKRSEMLNKVSATINWYFDKYSDSSDRIYRSSIKSLSNHILEVMEQYGVLPPLVDVINMNAKEVESRFKLEDGAEFSEDSITVTGKVSRWESEDEI